MSTSSRYDGSLQMFVDEVHAPDLAHLAFLRWLGERGLLEHDVYGASPGEFVGARDTAEATASLPHGTTL